MVYAVTADVDNLIAKFPRTSSTKPTTTQTSLIISDISNEIDVALSSQGVTVPVTAPSFFVDWLGLLNGYGAAAAVLKSMFPDSQGAAESPAYAFWEKRYQDGLKSLRDGTGIPTDVIGATSGYVAPSTYFTNNPDTEVDLGDIAEPRFKMDMTF